MTDPPAPPPEENRGRVGDYALLKELGRGGQGTVHLAEDLRLGRKVALKLLDRSGIGDGDGLERFRREALAASALRHPGICAVYEGRLDGPTPFIAMQYVEGETLATRVAATKSRISATLGGVGTTDVHVDLATNAEPVVAPEASEVVEGVLDRATTFEFVRIAEGAARALHAAHEAGVVHRDVKPGNVMIGLDGAPVLLDFGLARREEAGLASLTRAGDLCGTPAYMSPEQLGRGGRRVDARTDVWSLGATLYECLALRRPFEAPTREGLYRAILETEPTSLRRRNRAIPRDLDVVVATALAKEVDRRYQTALDFAEDLRRVRAHEPIRARRPGPAARLLLFARREPARAALLAVLVVTLPVIAALGTSWAKDRPAAEAARRAALDANAQADLAEASFELAEGDALKARDLFERVLAAGPGPASSAAAAAGVVLADVKRGDAAAASRALARARPLLGGGVALEMLEADVRRATHGPEDDGAASRKTPVPKTAVDFELLAHREMLAGEALGDESKEGVAAFRRASALAMQAILLAPSPRLDLYALRVHAAGHAADVSAVTETATALRRRWPRVGQAHFWAAFAIDAAAPGDPRFFAESLAAARDSVRLMPGSAPAWSNAARIFDAAGLRDDAEAALREAVRLAPRSEQFRRFLALTLREHGKSDEAFAVLAAAAAEIPDAVAAVTLCGVLHSEDERYEEAIAAFQEALRRDPNAVEPRRELGEAYRAVARFDAAIEAYEEVLARSTPTGEALCNYASLLEVVGRHAEAAAAYRRGEAAGRGRDDWNYPAGEWAARAEAAARADVEALEAARSHDAAGTRPDEPAETARLAGALQRAGRVAEAAAWWRAAIEDDPALLGPGGGRSVFDAACAAAAAGDRALAIRCLTAELELLRGAAASSAEEAAAVRREVDRRRFDPALARVRGAALDAFAPDDRAPFDAYWAALDALRSPPVGR